MRKTNGELNEMIAGQEALIPESAEMVDVTRGHVSRANGQVVKNRIEAIKALENQKELSSVNLKAGI